MSVELENNNILDTPKSRTVSDELHEVISNIEFVLTFLECDLQFNEWVKKSYAGDNAQTWEHAHEISENIEHFTMQELQKTTKQLRDIQALYDRTLYDAGIIDNELRGAKND